LLVITAVLPQLYICTLFSVALSDSLTGLKLCSPGSRSKPLNLWWRSEVDSFRGHRPDASQWSMPPPHTLF